TDVAYEPGDVLLFGAEPTGLPEDVQHHPRVTDRLRLPMMAGRRSMNLANCAAIAVYEAWRQHDFAGGS
ncbi:MAG: tRNA (uridine(34)/cytosine(34)/5-carboxymethylaminomethyluridine(34)-2'-O)-methyltransferase TrmL, partial [Actinomycetales bacterium]